MAALSKFSHLYSYHEEGFGHTYGSRSKANLQRKLMSRCWCMGSLQGNMNPRCADDRREKFQLALGTRTGRALSNGVELLSKELLPDSSMQWYHKFEKIQAEHPHRQEANWILSKATLNTRERRLETLKPRVVRRSTLSWNGRLSRCVKDKDYMKALQLYDQMQREYVNPDKFTFIPLLKACASLGALQQGKLIHEEISRVGCELDMFVGSSLVDMYAKCGSIAEACAIFDKMPERDVVAWSAMIVGCSKCGQEQHALHLFQQMRQNKVEPNRVTYVGVLNACASLGTIQNGRFVHKLVIESGLASDLFVCNALIDMYFKCNSVEDAHRVFENMPIHNVVSWSAMVLGYAKHGQGQKALRLFRQMLHEHVEPDKIALLAILNACTSSLALEEGKFVHSLVIQKQLQDDLHVGSALVDMYSKCGSLQDARKVFDNIPNPGLVTWTSMIGGYALHGLAKDAFRLFDRMCQTGVILDNGTFVSLFLAWTHSGHVLEGLYFVESMNPVYGLQATIEHYSCMIDLLGRSGLLCEMEEMITNMPWQPDAHIWTAVHDACKIHDKRPMERLAAGKLLEPEHIA